MGPGLIGRHAELFWPDDNLWYLIRIQVGAGCMAGVESWSGAGLGFVGGIDPWYLIRVQVSWWAG